MDEDNRYLKLQAQGWTAPSIDARLREDADFIVNGACNPVAVSRVLADMTQYLSRAGHEHPAIRAHPAVRLVLDQLAVIVFGQNLAALADYEACAPKAA